MIEYEKAVVLGGWDGEVGNGIEEGRRWRVGGVGGQDKIKRDIEKMEKKDKEKDTLSRREIQRLNRWGKF